MTATPFVVLATQRTGWTWLVDMLDDHPQIACYSEMFLEGASGHPRWGGRKDLRFFADVQMPIAAYLEQMVNRPQLQAVGWKLMYGQAGAHPAVLPLVADHHGVVIHLRRDNVLAGLISAELAVHRDVFHSRHDIGDRARITMSTKRLPERIREHVQLWDRWRHRLDRLGVCSVEITYESICDSPGSALAPPLRALGVDPDLVLTSDLRRVTDGDHMDHITNRDAVEAALAGTPFAWMVDG